MKFYTKYSKRAIDYENVDKTSVVKVAGYVPPDIQINRMIQAGEVFQLNAEAYDVGRFVADDVRSFNDHYKKVLEMSEDDFYMRRPEADILDATERIREVNERRKRASALARRVVAQRNDIDALASAALGNEQQVEDKSTTKAKE